MGNLENNMIGNVNNVSFEGLVGPANLLVEKIACGLGGFFAPYQRVRMAKAEVAAAIIKAEGDVSVSEVQQRAARRFVEEETRKQVNMENITFKALPHLEENSDASQMDDDWITNFFDKCRIISDDEMQELWAKVLAGEANMPGTYSKRTVNFLSGLDKLDAELFTKLCSFAFRIDGEEKPLIFKHDADIYKGNGIVFDGLRHLESIGLICSDIGNFSSGYGTQELPRDLNVHYYGRLLKLTMPKEMDNMLEVGLVLLTKMGQELAPLCDSQPVDGFFEYAKEQWKEYLPKPEANDSDER